MADSHGWIEDEDGNLHYGKFVDPPFRGGDFVDYGGYTGEVIDLKGEQVLVHFNEQGDPGEPEEEWVSFLQLEKIEVRSVGELRE